MEQKFLMSYISQLLKKQHQLMPVKFPCHEAAQTAATPLQRTFLWENIIKENSQLILSPKQNLHITKIKKIQEN